MVQDEGKKRRRPASMQKFVRDAFRLYEERGRKETWALKGKVITSLKKALSGEGGSENELR